MSEAYFAIPWGFMSAACPRVLDGALTYSHTRKETAKWSVSHSVIQVKLCHSGVSPSGHSLLKAELDKIFIFHEI